MSQRSVLTIGNFDGVHVGHAAIVRRAAEVAQQRGAVVRALTFDPPPVAVLRPEALPPRLGSLAQRCRWLLQAGAHESVVLAVTAELVSRSAEEFIAELVERYKPVAIVEGPDFRFGKGRGGDHALLVSLGERMGFHALRVDRVEVSLHDQLVAPLSSSLVRWLVGRGRVEDAARCLGRPFTLEAAVVRGEQRGRTIGVPTANLDPATLEGHLIPADGVYAGEAHWTDALGRPHTHNAAISVGTKPTFGRQTLTVEAHLLGYAPDSPDALYGEVVELRFTRWLRDQYTFPGLEPLRQQLARDLQQAQGNAS